jgi:hypothetical protein
MQNEPIEASELTTAHPTREPVLRA